MTTLARPFNKKTLQELSARHEIGSSSVWKKTDNSQLKKMMCNYVCYFDKIKNTCWFEFFKNHNGTIVNFSLLIIQHSIRFARFKLETNKTLPTNIQHHIRGTGNVMRKMLHNFVTQHKNGIVSVILKIPKQSPNVILNEDLRTLGSWWLIAKFVVLLINKIIIKMIIN